LCHKTFGDLKKRVSKISWIYTRKKNQKIPDLCGGKNARFVGKKKYYLWLGHSWGGRGFVVKC
jgi:hypothetical protein